MFPTCAVTCTLHDQSSQPEVGASVQARLDQYETYNGYVVPELVTAKTDANGQCTLDLWPNVLGSKGSKYNITIVATKGKRVRVVADVPNTATAFLHEIAEIQA